MLGRLRFRDDRGAASDLLFRLVTGVVAVAVVVSLESKLVGHLFGVATGLFAAGTH